MDKHAPLLTNSLGQLLDINWSTFGQTFIGHISLVFHLTLDYVFGNSRPTLEQVLIIIFNCHFGIFFVVNHYYLGIVIISPYRHI